MNAKSFVTICGQAAIEEVIKERFFLYIDIDHIFCTIFLKTEVGENNGK
jgi:DNA polymerase elongation subunit (family B)